LNGNKEVKKPRAKIKNIAPIKHLGYLEYSWQVSESRYITVEQLRREK
jgi:hypothetical protein